MIYTVTFNPSLDYIVTVDDFMTGVVNRTSKEIIFPGGKGINVSMVLSNLGYKNTALGFMARKSEAKSTLPSTQLICEELSASSKVRTRCEYTTLLDKLE